MNTAATAAAVTSRPIPPKDIPAASLHSIQSLVISSSSFFNGKRIRFISERRRDRQKERENSGAAQQAKLSVGGRHTHTCTERRDTFPSLGGY